MNCTEFHIGMWKAKVLEQMGLEETIGATHYANLQV